MHEYQYYLIMHKTTVMLREDQHEYLKKKAFDEGTSIGYIIRELVNTIIMDKPKDPEDLLKPLIDDAVDFYERNKKELKKGGMVAEVNDEKSPAIRSVPKGKFNLKNK